MSKKKLFDNVKEFFGFPDGIEEDEELRFEDSGITEVEINKGSTVQNEVESTPAPHIPHTGFKQKQTSSLENEISSGSNCQTIFLDPKAFSDCRKIVDYIRADKMVTLNLEYLDEDTAIRLMNFLSGAMTVKESNYLVISKKVYTIVPKSMKVYYEDKKTMNPRIFKDFGKEER
ncbi:cell division protein SepF [Fusobacterium sp.]|uniref:cell division protein SepF n=1 Tax=Fusobacterium sp. TaxID=68766 RepID=UPI0025C1DB82|nr:cell division protein SepF [Fusobacterium sp.]